MKTDVNTTGKDKIVLVELNDIYRYTWFIYECDRCHAKYPIWMVPDKEWIRGVRNMGRGFRPAKHICKRCFEEFNPSPNYLTLDEYLDSQEKLLAATDDPLLDYIRTPEGIARRRETITAIWDLPPSLDEEDHDETIEEIGWPQGHTISH